jgi:hypothetical protein
MIRDIISLETFSFETSVPLGMIWSEQGRGCGGALNIRSCNGGTILVHEVRGSMMEQLMEMAKIE